MRERSDQMMIARMEKVYAMSKEAGRHRKLLQLKCSSLFDVLGKRMQNLCERNCRESCFDSNLRLSRDSPCEGSPAHKFPVFQQEPFMPLISP